MTNLKKSTEIRWFFKGKVLNIVRDWFNRYANLDNHPKDIEGEEREDLYLLSSEANYIAPKLREGRFEIKLLIDSKEILGLDGKPIGKGENWRKWKWKYLDKKESDQKKEDPVVLHFFKATPKELRFQVWKNRRQRKFRVADKGRLELVPLRQKDLPFGILAELTELKINTEQWWTIAFEVFGNIDNPMEILQQGVNEIIKEYPGQALEVHNSYSYPEWISGL